MSTTWRVLMVDEERDFLDVTRRTLERRPLNTAGDMCVVDTEADFAGALERLSATRPDVVILDIVDDQAGDSGEQAGFAAFEAIRERQFVPVIFYTALPDKPDISVGAPFAQIVSKTENEDDGEEYPIRQALAAVIESGLPAIQRAMADLTQSVDRAVMIEVVEPHWDDLKVPGRAQEVGHLLARSLARALDASGDQLEQALAGSGGAARNGAHPLRFYVFHQSGSYETGEILYLVPPTGKAIEGEQPAVQAQPPPGWWVIVTPACDLVADEPRSPKAEFVVLAACTPLNDHAYAREFASKPKVGEGSGNRRKAVEHLIQDKAAPENRFRFLPKAWSVPDLVVDFQQVVSVPFAALAAYTRVARLDAPYAQSLIAQMVQYLVRTGTPDLDKPAETARILALLDPVASPRESPGS